MFICLCVRYTIRQFQAWASQIWEDGGISSGAGYYSLCLVSEFES